MQGLSFSEAGGGLSSQTRDDPASPAVQGGFLTTGPEESLFFEVLIEFVTALLLFSVLVVWLQGMWDLRSLGREGTCTPDIGR